MRWKRGAVLGSGKLAADCGKILANRQLPVEIYDMGDSFSDFLALGAKRAGIPYYALEPAEVFQKLAAVSEATLIVSAINPKILPPYLLRNPHILAVNCHQALLPAHPGRNAEMWAIYEGDQKTGITWHIAAEKVDSGAILLQKELPITSDSTAYRIFQQQIRLAGEAFEELAPGLMEREAFADLAPNLVEEEGFREQERSLAPEEAVAEGAAMSDKSAEGGAPQKAAPKLHYSWQVPNDGILDPEWDAGKISRFLRATDYGILPVIPAPEIRVKGQRYGWKKYKITEEQRFPEGLWQEGEVLWLQKESLLFELHLTERKEPLVSR